MTMPLDETVLLDRPAGITAVTRGRADVWVFSRADRRVATVRHTPDDEYRWHVRPASAFVDEDDAQFDEWAEVLRVIDGMPLSEV
ncbi:hypothetical protein [Curtobacterium sp. UCD-KPL2560]|uniref:hypothetical protein n=1 Tax=Curtobacterium sp. UCD-KPL2560 TaxID=1885315 RepID=UPI000826009E|nr:hypothetical protein [Curtobacterium sp. UCD-KPL2560]